MLPSLSGNRDSGPGSPAPQVRAPSYVARVFLFFYFGALTWVEK